MTALAGYWGLDRRGDAGARCSDMLQAQACYATGKPRLATVGGLGIGRSLFALLPEDAGDVQPLISADERFALVADLRIDNRQELIRSLDLNGPGAGTLADSAILFSALLRWGEATLARMVGDYAFAFFDAGERRLILARDPLGQRPLFWHRGNGFVAFASMPSGLHSLEAIPRRPSIEALSRFLALLPVEGEASYFEGVSRVQPGHVVTVTPVAVSRRRFWSPERRELRLKSFGDYVEAYRFHLDQAVDARSRGSERLVASHLSGGWDSSAVTATAARRLRSAGGKVIALTSVPSRAGTAPANRFADEGPLAAATARLYSNIEHVVIESPQRSIVADLRDYHSAFQRPPFNLLNHPWLADIREAARARGARILLTGEIGNWTISASPSSILADFIREGRWSDWLREASAMLSSGRTRVRGVAANSFGPWMPDFAWRGIRRLSSAPSPAEQSALHPHLAAALRDARKEYDSGPASRPKDNFDRTVRAFFEMDFGEYRKGILGGWGIDKRDATADVRLIEFCLSLPIEMLAAGGVRRPLARAALADRLPDAVLDERRKGYQAADWHIGMTEHLPEISALIDEIAQHDLAASLVDVDLLRRWVRTWPQTGWERMEVIGRYRTALPEALNAGAFVLANCR